MTTTGNGASASSTDDVVDTYVTAELARLADVLAGLDDDGWATASLCKGWTVRHVVAHLTMPARSATPAVLVGLLLSGFRWNSFADKAARRDAALPTERLLADLRSNRLAAWRPPGGGAAGALVHALVHSLDVTIPLGASRPGDPERLRVALDALVAPTSLKHFGVDLDGVELRARDAAWSHGTGRVVAADSETIVLVLSGRAPLPPAH